MTPRRQAPRPAKTELIVLNQWHEFTGWFLTRTARWPKAIRFTLTQRLENHCLDIIEQLTIARYDRAQRSSQLKDINLKLERMRLLLRLAKQRQALPNKSFESAMREIDEVGRSLYQWRQTLSKRSPES